MAKHYISLNGKIIPLKNLPGNATSFSSIIKIKSLNLGEVKDVKIFLKSKSNKICPKEPLQIMSREKEGDHQNYH